MAAELRARPATATGHPTGAARDRDRAERLLADLGAGPRGRRNADSVLAHAQMLLAAAKSGAVTEFERAAQVVRDGPRVTATADLALSIHDGWARALRALGRAAGVAVLRRASRPRTAGSPPPAPAPDAGAGRRPPEPAEEIATRRICGARSSRRIHRAGSPMRSSAPASRARPRSCWNSA